MARLSAEARAKLPKKEFAGPKIHGRPSFPLNDRNHDMAAIIDVKKAVRAGHITAEEGAEIKAHARANLRGMRGKA